jgi:hypothetical protein
LGATFHYKWHPIYVNSRVQASKTKRRRQQQCPGGFMATAVEHVPQHQRGSRAISACHRGAPPNAASRTSLRGLSTHPAREKLPRSGSSADTGETDPSGIAQHGFGHTSHDALRTARPACPVGGATAIDQCTARSCFIPRSTFQKEQFRNRSKGLPYSGSTIEPGFLFDTTKNLPLRGTGGANDDYLFVP